METTLKHKTGRYANPHPNIELKDGAGFADRLEYLLLKYGVSQRTLANAVFCSGDTIHKYVTGKSEPNVTMAVSIAKYFCVSMNWLCGMED